jgi:hypothetical protein
MAAAARVRRLVGWGALLLLLGVAAPAPGASTAPSLRMLDASPVRLAGAGFSPGERVRVRASAGGERRSRRVHANSRGRFRVSFAGMALDPCAEVLSATATGSKGHRASLKQMPQRLCPPALRPYPGPPAY